MHDAADIEALQSGDWLRSQPEVFRNALIEAAVWREIKAGTTINHGGDAVGGMWGVARGQVDMSSALSTADSPIADIHLPGRWGGTGPIFGKPRAADGTVRVASLIAFVPLPRLQVLLHQNPEWWQCLGQLAIEYAYRYGGATGDLLIRDSRLRCIAVLLRLADCRHHDPLRPPNIFLSQIDFAAAVNMARHTAGEVLRQLRAAGHIELGYCSVTIRDAAALRAMVDG